MEERLRVKGARRTRFASFSSPMVTGSRRLRSRRLESRRLGSRRLGSRRLGSRRLGSRRLGIAGSALKRYLYDDRMFDIRRTSNI